MLDLSLPRNRMDRIRSELSHCSGECYKIQITDIRLIGKLFLIQCDLCDLWQDSRHNFQFLRVWLRQRWKSYKCIKQNTKCLITRTYMHLFNLMLCAFEREKNLSFRTISCLYFLLDVFPSIIIIIKRRLIKWTI